MRWTDAAMSHFYEDPKNRKPAGPGFRRRKKDWVEDVSMSKEERLEKFESLEPAEILKPKEVIQKLRDEKKELSKKNKRLLAGLFLLHQKYSPENSEGMFDNQNNLLDSLRVDVVAIMDGLDVIDWASSEALKIWPKTQWDKLIAEEKAEEWQEVSFINGPARGFKFGLKEAPRRLEIFNVVYDRIDDPDTGEFLGGYAVVEK